jgi:hypothetical protein
MISSMTVMLTHAECIAKAVAMEEKAERLPDMRAECLEIAECWRFLAASAKWQDAYKAALD